MIRKLFEKIKGGFGMKNWSLKKKIAIGVAAIGTAILGVFAYGKYNQEVQLEDDFDEDEDFEEDVTDNSVDFESEGTVE